MRKKPSMIMVFAFLAVILVCCCLAEPSSSSENLKKSEPKSKPEPEPEPNLKLGNICKYQMSFKGKVVGQHFMEEYGWLPCDFPEDPVESTEYHYTVNGTDIYQYVFTFRKGKPVASLCNLSEEEVPLFCGTRTVRKCGEEWALLDVYMADPWKYSLDLIWTKENRLVHLSTPDMEILESPKVLRILKLVPYWTDCAENALAEELAFNQNEDESHPSSRAMA